MYTSYTSEILGSVMRLKLRWWIYGSFAYFVWFYSQSQCLVIKHAQFLETASRSVWWDQCESMSIVCSYQRCSALRNLKSPSTVTRVRNKPYPELQHHFMNVENDVSQQLRYLCMFRIWLSYDRISSHVITGLLMLLMHGFVHVLCMILLWRGFAHCGRLICASVGLD